MNDRHHFEVKDGVAVFRPVGTLHFEAAVGLVRSAIARALSQGQNRLLVDAINVVGFDPPGVPERHAMARDWADAAQGRLRIAMVVRPEFIDADKFGIVAGANFGLVADVFRTESDALEWLRTGKPA